MEIVRRYKTFGTNVPHKTKIHIFSVETRKYCPPALGHYSHVETKDTAILA